jgi:multidrug resistance protein
MASSAQGKPSSCHGTLKPSSDSPRAPLQPPETQNVFQQESSVADQTPYSTFTLSEKRGIVFLVAVAGFFSPFSAFIYFPALNAIAQSLSVSLELMNLTITMYLLIQGIVPSVFGDLSDTLGRRPTYLLVFLIYLFASLGLAFQDSYTALLVLRMVQSAGSSGTIALAYGVIGDIAPQHERGGYVGIAHIGFNSAPSLGPILGGVLAQTVGWRWIFRTLVIFSGLTLILFLVFLPETLRKIVGNGSKPASGMNLSLLQLLRSDQTPQLRGDRSYRRPQVRVPNPFKCVRMIFHKNTALVLSSNAIFYMKYSCVQASLSPLLMKTYGLNTLQAGLTYLAFGIASAVASYGAGKITDYDYRKTASAHGFSINNVSGDKLMEFPIEKARLRSVWYYIFISSTSTLGYGWAVQRRAHLAVPLVMQFLVGLAVTGIFNVCNTLIVDLHPDAPATASASVSITRCLTAAVGLSVQQLLFDSIGVGWTFTLIAGLCYVTVPCLVVVKCRGWDWRRETGFSAGRSAESPAMTDCAETQICQAPKPGT